MPDVNTNQTKVAQNQTNLGLFRSALSIFRPVRQNVLKTGLKRVRFVLIGANFDHFRPLSNTPDFVTANTGNSAIFSSFRANLGINNELGKGPIDV